MVSLYFGLSAHHQESEKTEYKFEKCLQMTIFILRNKHGGGSEGGEDNTY